MDENYIDFTAVTVECEEDLDWEFVQVTFDTQPQTHDEERRITPYLLLSVSFEFDEIVQLEFHDGKNYHGDKLHKLDLWRDRIHVFSRKGFELHIRFDLLEASFLELRKYLEVLSQDVVFHPNQSQQ